MKRSDNKKRKEIAKGAEPFKREDRLARKRSVVAVYEEKAGEIAYQHFAKGRYKSALEAFEAASAVNPGNSMLELYIEGCKAKLEAGTKEGQREMKEVQPRSSFAESVEASTPRTKRRKAALRAEAKMMSYSPGRPVHEQQRTYYSEGSMLLGTGQARAAVIPLKTAINKDPGEKHDSTVASHIGLAIAHLKEGDSNSEYHFKKALQLLREGKGKGIGSTSIDRLAELASELGERGGVDLGRGRC